MKNVNSDIAYEFIRKRILNGTFPPGHPLMTQDLSAEIGVSRTPVRDALRQLETDGLVVIRKRMGASVKTMDAKEYREMCGLRMAMEVYAAGLAAENRSVDELHEMEDALEAMRRLTEASIESDDNDEEIIKSLRREDVRFHVAIISSAKSDLLKKEVLRLHIINRVVSGLESVKTFTAKSKEERDARRRQVQTSHEEIYRAIAKGDVAEAKAAMENHIRDIIDAVIRAMLRDERMAIPRNLTEEELSYTV
jgi:DNA-binding GntR family transcriptional regulator